MRPCLTLDELTPAELDRLYAQTLTLKRARATGVAPTPALAGKTVALLFEKPSLRTRVSFEVAARELGGASLYLSPQEVGLGAREAIGDVARVLSTYVHVVVVRTFHHARVEELARHASIPVINGLTDAHHPCQGLTDIFTVGEHFGATGGRTLARFGARQQRADPALQGARVAVPAGRLSDPPGSPARP